MNDNVKSDVKTAAIEAIHALPTDATWDDVMYRIFIRQKIDSGLADAESGNLVSTDEVRRRLGFHNEG